MAAETIRSHHDRLECITDDVDRLGYRVAANILSGAMPQTPKGRLGDLGEILATSRGFTTPPIVRCDRLLPQECAVLCRALKVHLDLPITLVASALYRILACRLGNGWQSARARNLFRKIVSVSANIEIKPDEIAVTIGQRANNPVLIAAGHTEPEQGIPWLHNRALSIRFV